MIRGIGIRTGQRFRNTCTIVSWVIALVPFLGAGCADCGNALQVRGRLLDAESGEPLAGAIIGGRSSTDGLETDHAPPLIFNGEPGGPPSDAVGSFVLEFTNYFGSCPAPDFPRPDQVEIIIIRDGCEQQISVMIEINEDTAQFVDGEFPGDEVLELTDPILVPPCEELP